MSENLELLRRNLKGFRETGELQAQRFSDDFVWDMSQFRGWPERPTYEGVEGTQVFLRDWAEAWEDWSLEAVDYREVDDRVIGVMRQVGRSKISGLEVDMTFAQVWTFRDGQITRMTMYADADEAFEAVGLTA